MNFEYVNDISVCWENEDELPDMPDIVYNVMFPVSKVDFVRYFPYIKINNKKYFLIDLESFYYQEKF
jgi:hypothetical protein